MNPSLSSLVADIDLLLPQTQCTKCGFEGCEPYAQALATQEADINRCPPGGPELIDTLASFLQRPSLPLNPECGEHKPLHVARIQEEHCIGCTLCIRACPVDAIVGANKRMHTVIAELCSGCELCLPVCPVDCIHMDEAVRPWTPEDAVHARQRVQQRRIRLARIDQIKAQKLEEKALLKQAQLPNDQEHARKQSIIEAALARARQKRQHHESS